MCMVWTGVWQAVVVIAGSTGVVVSGWQDESMDRAGVGWSPATHDILHTLALCSLSTAQDRPLYGPQSVAAIRL